jgi:hypothetical protein
MKGIASWRIQTRQGATIGFLQQCLGSQTISSAFITAIRLRAFDSFAVLSMVLWCLSPLGSQASLRVISIVDHYSETPITMSTPNTFFEYQFSSSEAYGEAGTRVSSPVLAAFSAASLLGTRNQDLWGGIRFPMMDNLETIGNEWVDVPQTNNLTYSSLIGTPVGPLPSFGNTSFTLPGSYLSISCPVFGTTKNPKFANWTSTTPRNGIDCSWDSSEGGTTYKIAISRPCVPHLMNTTSRNARKLIWESSTGSEKTGWTWAVCDLTTAYVDVNVTCTGSPSGSSSLSTCNLSSARRSPKTQYNTNWTVFDIVYDGRYKYSNNNDDAKNVLGILTGLFPHYMPSAGMEPVLAYFTEPYHAVGLHESPSSRETYAIGRKVFQTRLAQLLNSILFVGIDPTVFTGSWDLSERMKSEGALKLTAINSQHYQVVRCSRPWLGVLIVASLTIFVCALIGAIARIITIAPDVLGSITVILLQNKIVGAAGSSVWSCDEWTRSLRNTKLYLGDVQPEADVGCIALATSRQDVEIISSKGRYYR